MGVFSILNEHKKDLESAIKRKEERTKSKKDMKYNTCGDCTIRCQHNTNSVKGENNKMKEVYANTTLVGNERLTDDEILNKLRNNEPFGEMNSEDLYIDLTINDKKLSHSFYTGNATRQKLNIYHNGNVVELPMVALSELYFAASIIKCIIKDEEIGNLTNYINWDEISKLPLSEKFIDENLIHINWSVFSRCYKFDIKSFDKYKQLLKPRYLVLNPSFNFNWLSELVMDNDLRDEINLAK